MKKLSLVLALVFALAGLGGISLAEEEPVTIEFMTTEFVNAALTNETLTIQALEEALNIHLDLNIAAASTADYAEKFNLMLASGDYPDIMMATADLVSPYLDTGIFLELTEIMPERMPNVYEQVQAYGVLKDITTDDGKLWFIPKLEGSVAIWEIDWINQDWLDELGLEIPTNTDELYEVLKAFKENKGEDCIPLIMGPWSGKLENFYYAFNTWDTWRMFNEEDGMEYGPYDHAEEMRACLAYLNKLYAEGLLDNQYLTRDDDSINALISNNQAGYFYAWADDAARLIEGGTLGVNYSYVDPLEGPEGYSGWYGCSSVGTRFYINAHSEVLDKVIEMCDYIFSEEGRNLFTWGVEGVTYNVVDGEKQYVDEIMEYGGGALDGRRQFGMNPVNFLHVSEWEGWLGVLPEYVTMIAANTADSVAPVEPILSSTPEEETELANIMTDITKYVDSQLPLFVNGTLNTEEDFDAFIAQLEDMGILEAKAIKDAQFERWQNR